MLQTKCLIQVRGEGPKNAKIMIIGEAPGGTEVEKNRPFVGKAGRFLSKTLESVGIYRSECYVTNIVKFRPTKRVDGKIKDRPPTKNEIEPYLPLLRKELGTVRPGLIILLGSIAVETMTGRKISEMRGKPFRMLAAVSPAHQSIVVSAYHPAAAMRNRMFRKKFVADLKRAKLLQKADVNACEYLQRENSDWHIHTNFSDGRSTPSIVVAHAKRLGLGSIAICDHDNLDGIREATRTGERCGVQVVPSVEITANDTIDGKRGIVHILGISVNAGSGELRRVCQRNRLNRINYVKDCVEELQRRGFDIQLSKVMARIRGSPGFGYAIQELRSNPANEIRLKTLLRLKRLPHRFMDTPEIIKDILLKGASIREAITVIRKAGGIPVIAHPGNPERYGILHIPDARLRHYAKLGLGGIELSQQHHTLEQNKHYKRLATELGLITTVGSDSHKL